MWFIQALRTVFPENVREEVLQMSCSWFLDGLKSNFRKHAKEAYFSFVLFWKFFLSTSNVSILVKVVVLIHFSLHTAEKCSSFHYYLAFGILVFITYFFFREVSDKKVIKALKRLVHCISIFPYIFLSLFIFSRVTLLLICNFELENDLDTSCNFSLVFVLKFYYSCCYCYCYFGYRRPATLAD